MEKEKITTENAPKVEHLLSQAIISNGLVFVAGQVHNTPDGKIVEGTVEIKMEQIMKNISFILEAANLTLDNIVKLTIYVTDMSQMLELNRVYPNYFKDILPAREAVCVKELPLGATIEISTIATK